MSKKITITITLLVSLFVCLVSTILAWVLFQVDYSDVEIKFDTLTIKLNLEDSPNQAQKRLDISDLMFIDDSDIKDTNLDWLLSVSKKYTVQVTSNTNTVISNLSLNISPNDISGTPSETNGLLIVAIKDGSSDTLVSKLSDLKTSLNGKTTLEEIRLTTNDFISDQFNVELQPNSSATYTLYFLGYYPALTLNPYRDDIIKTNYDVTLIFTLTQKIEEVNNNA